MLQFHPPGMGQRVVETSLGAMVYYTPVGSPWSVPASPAQPLLFLHNFGGGASAYEWSKVYPAFIDDYRVIAPDLIGWGQSAHPVRNYQLQDYLTTLTEFIEQACQMPAIVVASSLTGAIALRLATQRPDLFRALCLTCPAGFEDFGQAAGRRLPLELISNPFLDQVIYAIGAMNELSVRNFLERFLFAQPSRVSAEMVAAYLDSAVQPNAQAAALAFLKGHLYFDLAPDVPRLTIPTLMLWGAQAQFTNAALGQRLAQLNPVAIQSFQVIPDVGVLPQLELPGVAIALIRRFLQTLPNP
jgi:pimeloyl-ACP methyl ester carboxylesterase